MSKEQKDHAIKIIFANEFRFEPDHIEIKKRQTPEQIILVWFLKAALLGLIVLTLLVGAAIFYA